VRRSRRNECESWGTSQRQRVPATPDGDLLTRRAQLHQVPTVRYIGGLTGSRSRASDVESSRHASICAFRSAIFCSAAAMASARATKRRGGGSWLAIVTSARASLAGSPDCCPFWALQNSSSRRAALVVIRDGRLGVVCRLLRDQFRAEEPWIDDGGRDTEGATSACSDSIQPSRPNLDAA
jgi:hypothetical protein